MQSAFDSSRRGLVLFDADCRIVFMNRRYRELLGLDEAALGSTLAEMARRNLGGAHGKSGDAALRTLEYLLLSQNKIASRLTQEIAGGRFVNIEHEPLAKGGFLHIVQELSRSSVEAPGSSQRRRLEADLSRALVERQFELYYQPIVGVEPFRIAGFEALLRWRHPEHGLVPPTQFIPVAEEIGLIGAIGEWVLEEACSQAASWPAEVRIAVNLSPSQLRCESFLPTVVDALKKTGLDPTRLELEITENLLMDNSETVLSTLRELRAMGLRIAVDDFGTGYSSLNYLRKFRFDKVKIDRVFVKDVGESADCLAILRAVTGLCVSLGIETTAEGVETVEQMSAAMAEKCTQMQGFLFSRPQPSSEIPAMMAAVLKQSNAAGPAAAAQAKPAG
ncbi:MAG TPA: EAL domain-containing protein [Beijerinckiaceae bacterium]|nr:EAL domain-containing protein [Beijerinckiaceae bacterium]